MRLSDFIKVNAHQILSEWEKFTKKIRRQASLPRWFLCHHAAAIIKLIVEEMEHSPPVTD